MPREHILLFLQRQPEQQPVIRHRPHNALRLALPYHLLDPGPHHIAQHRQIRRPIPPQIIPIAQSPQRPAIRLQEKQRLIRQNRLLVGRSRATLPGKLPGHRSKHQPIRTLTHPEPATCPNHQRILRTHPLNHMARFTRQRPEPTPIIQGGTPEILKIPRHTRPQGLWTQLCPTPHRPLLMQRHGARETLHLAPRAFRPQRSRRRAPKRCVNRGRDHRGTGKCRDPHQPINHRIRCLQNETWHRSSRCRIPIPGHHPQPVITFFIRRPGNGNIPILLPLPTPHHHISPIRRLAFKMHGAGPNPITENFITPNQPHLRARSRKGPHRSHILRECRLPSMRNLPPGPHMRRLPDRRRCRQRHIARSSRCRDRLFRDVLIPHRWPPFQRAIAPNRPRPGIRQISLADCSPGPSIFLKLKRSGTRPIVIIQQELNPVAFASHQRKRRTLLRAKTHGNDHRGTASRPSRRAFKHHPGIIVDPARLKLVAPACRWHKPRPHALNAGRITPTRPSRCPARGHRCRRRMSIRPRRRRRYRCHPERRSSPPLQRCRARRRCSHHPTATSRPASFRLMDFPHSPILIPIMPEDQRRMVVMREVNHIIHLANLHLIQLRRRIRMRHEIPQQHAILPEPPRSRPQLCHNLRIGKFHPHQPRCHRIRLAPPKVFKPRPAGQWPMRFHNKILQDPTPGFILLHTHPRIHQRCQGPGIETALKSMHAHSTVAPLAATNILR